MYLLKYKEYDLPVMPVYGSSFSGEYKLVARNKESGKITYESPWQKNLITDYGLTYIGINYWLNYLAVGTGNTLPVNSNTALNSFLSIKGTTDSTTSYAQTNTYPGLKCTITRSFRFDESVVGVIRELGAARTSSTDFAGGNNQLITHALVSPEYNKTAAEILDVYYRVTRYWDKLAEMSNTGQISLESLIYNYTIAGYKTASSSNSTWNPIGDNEIYFRLFGSTGPAVEPLNTDLVWNAAGALSNPTYTSINWTTVGSTLVGDTAYREEGWQWDLNDGNNTSGLPYGIRSVYGCLNSAAFPGFQIEFSDTVNGYPIQKDRYKRLNLYLRNTWGRV